MINPGEWGHYKFCTYEQVNADIYAISRALLAQGITAGKKVGIYSGNRVEWTILEWACFIAGIVVVPLYDTLGEGAVEFILEQAEVSAAFTSKQNVATLEKVLCKPHFNHVKFYCFDDEKKSAKIGSWNDLLKTGGGLDIPIAHPARDDLAIIMYTSGTTGDPKGVSFFYNFEVFN